MNHRRADLATGLVLALLLFRAYVPVGFMPASGSPFALEICPSGMVGAMPEPDSGMHHAGADHSGAERPIRGGSHASFDSCPFGGAPTAAPVAHVVAFDHPERLLFQSLFAFSPAQPGMMLARAQRARGPPFLV